MGQYMERGGGITGFKLRVLGPDMATAREPATQMPSRRKHGPCPPRASAASYCEQTAPKWHEKEQEFLRSEPSVSGEGTGERTPASRTRGACSWVFTTAGTVTGAGRDGPPGRGSEEQGWVNRQPRCGSGQEELPETLAALGGRPTRPGAP